MCWSWPARAALMMLASVSGSPRLLPSETANLDGTRADPFCQGEGRAGIRPHSLPRPDLVRNRVATVRREHFVARRFLVDAHGEAKLASPQPSGVAAASTRRTPQRTSLRVGPPGRYRRRCPRPRNVPAGNRHPVRRAQARKSRRDPRLRASGRLARVVPSVCLVSGAGRSRGPALPWPSLHPTGTVSRASRQRRRSAERTLPRGRCRRCLPTGRLRRSRPLGDATVPGGAITCVRQPRPSTSAPTPSRDRR